MRTWSILVIAAGVAGAAGSAQAQQGGPPGGRAGGPGAGMGQPTLELVERFDANKDGWLNRDERATARSWLAMQPQTQGRAGGPPGAGGPPPGAGGSPPGGPPGAGGPPGGRGGTPGGPGGGRGRAYATATPGGPLTPADVRTVSTAPLYDLGTLRTYFFEFENSDWSEELAAFFNSDVEVPAKLTVDGRTYDNVGVGFRGASSYRMVPAASKKSLNVSVDMVNEDQALGGYRSLNLLNVNSDPTFVRTVLFATIARAYIPAPVVNFARVAINGENWGVYVNAQQFNSDFTLENYGTRQGARWKVPGSPGGRGGMEYLGDSVAQYRRLYEIKTKDNAKNWTDLIHLFQVLNTTPPEQLEAALKPILNVDGVLRFLAIDVALVNTDGYWTRASDYNIYQDTLGVFHVIPHDMNEALGTGGNVELDPLINAENSRMPLRSKLLAVPVLRERYLGYVRDIATNWLDWQKLEPLVQQHQALIAADVRADTRKLYSSEAFDTGVADLKSFVERRRAFLLK